MKNYVQDGGTINVAAPYAVASGGGALVGVLFGVAQSAAASGAEVPLVVTGVFTLPKAASQAWTVGARVYWDNTNKVCTTTASGNTLIGIATRAVANGANDLLGDVFIHPAYAA